MATKELRELRRHYRTTYTLYMHCIQAFADASERGEWPSDEIVRGEEKALNDFVSARHALMEALCAHAKRAESA